MATTVYRYPDALNLSGNMNKFEITVSKSIRFQLMHEDLVLIEQTYDAGSDGRIVIDVKEVVEAQLKYVLNASDNVCQQSSIFGDFSAIIDGGTPFDFRVIKCGVANNNATAVDFLKNHFLTWQAAQKKVTYYSPEWLTYYAIESCSVKVKAFFADSTSTELVLQSCVAGMAYTFNMQYAVVAGLLGNKLPSYYEVCAYRGSTRISEVQRYVADDAISEDESWILWENSLGGIDSARIFGKNSFSAKHTHEIAEIGGVDSEYNIELERITTKHTGPLDSHDKKWFLDFFVSKGKYVFAGSAIRKIVVTEDNVSFVEHDSINNYSFSYKYAESTPYLNLTKELNEIPVGMTMPVDGLPDFTLPPRIAEYSRVPVSEGVLLPCENPHSEKIGAVSIAAIRDFIVAGITFPEGGGSGDVDLAELKKYLNKNYLNKLTEDTAQERLYFLKGISAYGVSEFEDVKVSNLEAGEANIKTLEALLAKIKSLIAEKANIKNLDAQKALISDLKAKLAVIEEAINSPEFVSGFLSGKGWAIMMRDVVNIAGEIEKKSYGEFDELTIRGSLRVFEMIINQLKGESDNYIFSSMMKVDHIDIAERKMYLDTGGGILYNPFRANDILKCQQFGGSINLDTDHGITKQYEVVVTTVGCGSLVDGEDRLDWITYDAFEGSESVVAKGDVLVRIDNLTDTDRKGIMMNTTVGPFAPYQDVVYGLKTDPDNAIKSRSGNLQGIHNPNFGWLKGFGDYLINLYAVGEFRFRNGEDIQTRLDIMENLFKVDMQKKTYELTEADNFLTNASFTENMSFWEKESIIKSYIAGGKLLMFNRALYADKEKIAGVEDYEGRNVLRIKNSTIKQLNTHIRKPEKGSKLYINLKIRCKASGTLTIGFDSTSNDTNTLASITEKIRHSYDPIVKSWDGVWDATGDFVLSFTGDAYFEYLSVTNRPLDDFKLEVGTKFEQTNESISLLGYRIDETNGTISDLGIRINAADESIRIWGNKTDELAGTITSLGIDLDAATGTLSLHANRLNSIDGSITDLGVRLNAAEGKLNLYANKTDELNGTITNLGIELDATNGTLSIHANRLNSIDGTVTNLGIRLNTAEKDLTLYAAKTDDIGNNVVSYINLSPGEIQISSDKIKLEGAVSVNGNFYIDIYGNMICNDATINGLIYAGSKQRLITSQVIDLSKGTSITIVSMAGYPQTYTLPSDVKYIGLNVYLRIPFVSKSAGPSFVKQQNGKGFLKTGGSHNASLTTLTTNTDDLWHFLGVADDFGGLQWCFMSSYLR